MSSFRCAAVLVFAIFVLLFLVLIWICWFDVVGCCFESWYYAAALVLWLSWLNAWDFA